MRTDVARGSTGKFCGTRKTMSCSLASAGSAVALSDGEEDKYVTEALGRTGALGDGEASGIPEGFASAEADAAGAAVGEAEVSGVVVPFKTSAIEGAT
jgi:hypothetical protein